MKKLPDINQDLSFIWDSGSLFIYAQCGGNAKTLYLLLFATALTVFSPSPPCY